DGGVDPSALRLEQLQICEVHHLGYGLPEPGAERAPGEWLVCANIFDLVVQLVLGEREPRIAGLLAEVELPRPERLWAFLCLRIPLREPEVRYLELVRVQARSLEGFGMV